MNSITALIEGSMCRIIDWKRRLIDKVGRISCFFVLWWYGYQKLANQPRRRLIGCAMLLYSYAACQIYCFWCCGWSMGWWFAWQVWSVCNSSPYLSSLADTSLCITSIPLLHTPSRSHTLIPVLQHMLHWVPDDRDMTTSITHMSCTLAGLASTISW